MWRVSIRPAADADLLDAKDWYDHQRAGLGEDFFLSIAEVLLRLEQSPEIFPIYYRGFRQALTVRFPYKVFFRIERTDVIVFRVLHVARDHAHGNYSGNEPKPD
jgi:toxin ParE1/3/4